MIGGEKDMMGFGWGYMWIWSAFLIVGITAVIYNLFSSSRSNSHSPNQGQNTINGSATDILIERYVSGEITKKQFRQLHKDQQNKADKKIV